MIADQEDSPTYWAESCGRYDPPRGCQCHASGHGRQHSNASA